MRIYLDFDGCRHCAGRNKFEHIERIEEVLREYPEAHVVISSSWREEHPFDEMRSYFAEDVQRQIVGVTPVLSLSHLVIQKSGLVTSHRAAGINGPL